MEDHLFETIYEQTARPLWAYVARISGDGSVADDILQETYLRFLRASGRPVDADEVRKYLYRIATNLVYDRFRSLSRRGEIAIVETFHGADDNFATGLELSQVFSRLKKQERVLLWLAYVEGCDHDQIAYIANVRKLSVKVLLFRARRKLAQLIKGEQV
jgi:RNA polymerase sigma-70 factor (ECF subfamily)